MLNLKTAESNPRVLNMWGTPTKQATSRTAYFEIWAISWKLSVREIPLDKELSAKLSRRNSYETRGADPGYDG